MIVSLVVLGPSANKSFLPHAQPTRDYAAQDLARVEQDLADLTHIRATRNGDMAPWENAQNSNPKIGNLAINLLMLDQ
jgi:hypothetical protein